MAGRPQNIGIKAIEVYFPSQVRLPSPLPRRLLLLPLGTCGRNTVYAPTSLTAANAVCGAIRTRKV